MKKPQYAHADAHVLAHARLTANDFAQIQIETDKAIQYDLEGRSRRAARSEARTHEAMPPLCNTGGTIQLRMEGGEIKEVVERVHSTSESAFIDWLNITVHETSFRWSQVSISEDQLISEISLVCESIFGFGITAQREKGALFYRQSYTLGDSFGLVCMGGQRNTILIQLNGEGCAASRSGWERRLYDFLQSAFQARITRIDLSHDDIEGALHSPETVEAAYDEGRFDLRGKRPDCEMRGNWKSPNGKGRTFYVGSRTCGKFFRGYEKGKQLGDADSRWFRLEVEFKSVNRIIPHECLLEPQDYFAAAYPYLSDISPTPVRILTARKVVEVSYERTKNWLRHQCGAAINALVQIEGDIEKALKLIVREGKIPKGLVPPSFAYPAEYFHHSKPVFLSMQDFDILME